MFLAELVLCICAIKIGVSYSDDCNNIMTNTSITIKKWLIIRGIVGLCILPIIILTVVCMIEQCKYKFPLAFVIITLIFTILFHSVWHIVGFVVLFHSNIECFNMKEPIAIYMCCDLIITLGLSVLYSLIFSSDDNDKNKHKNNRYEIIYDVLNNKRTNSTNV